MELVTGAMGSLIPKLKDLLMDEYKLQTRVKDQIRSLELDLNAAHAALREVGKVRPDQLDEPAKIWARDVREASYDMEDILDTYLVRVKGNRKPNDDQDNLLKRLGEKMTGLFKKSKERHKIAGAIEKIRKNLQEVTDRRGRYTVDNIVAKPAASLRTVDPRLTAMYREASQIIGIDKSSADLRSMLSPDGKDESNKKMKIVSVVGVGGLGKTTLAKAVYEELKSQFGCGAFVPVGQAPDLKKVFRDILIDLDKAKYRDLKFTMLDERQLIDELCDFLRTKRYFVVIDDIWEPQSWERIKLALIGNNCGSRVIITTRKFEVAKETDEVYGLQPLSYDDSKKLFYTRLFGGEDKCPTNHPDDLSNAILKKCGGVPLAIITMASLLLGKSRKEWHDVCDSPGFCQHNKDDKHMENTMHILSLSYYDLPCHLKTCLLYLSVFPEDTFIDKYSLIWMWIAEGFVEKKAGRGLFEVGEEYFHDLINRNMIQGVDSYNAYGIKDGCRVHDMVLDLIVSISHEENFVITDGTLSQSHARRLALKNRELDDLTQDTHVNLPQVRSFIVWRCVMNNDKSLLDHPRLKLIRVLALESCRFREGDHSLEHIGNLLHLRYLSLQDSRIIHKFSEGIGALKFLQILDLNRTEYELELPRSIGSLTQLVCLRALGSRVPDGVLGKLTSLEELQIQGPLDNYESKREFVKNLGNLCELRLLETNYACDADESMQTDLVQSLGNLKKMQHLKLVYYLTGDLNMNTWDAAVPSGDLRCLFISRILFPKLVSWINSVRLPSLSHLELSVRDMDEQGLKLLGGLPELCQLELITSSTLTITSSNTEAEGFFPKLRSLSVPFSIVQFVANEDSSASFITICNKWSPVSRKKDDCRVGPPAIVLPNLEEIRFRVRVEQLMRNNVSCKDLGLEYFPSLRKVSVQFHRNGAFEDDCQREEDALRDAIENHPNRPALKLERYGEVNKMRRSDGNDSVQSRNEEDEEETNDDEGSTSGVADGS